MRIAEVSAFSQYSVGKIMQEIKKYIEQNTDYVCEIFYARGNAKNEPGFHCFGNHFSIKANALMARIFDNDGFCLKSMTKNLIRQLELFNPDLIHIHCLHGYYLNAKELFAYFSKKANVKIVWTMHDAWAITGHCCFFSMIECEKWMTECSHCRLKKEYPSSLIFDNSKKNYYLKKELFTSMDKERLIIVTPSVWLKNIINKSFLSKYEVDVIYNGINIDLFNTHLENNCFDISFDKKTILGVASVWDKRKGLNTFIKLSEQLNKEWQIVLIGKINGRIKLPDNIIHIERTQNQYILKKYYQSAEVFVNPTIDDNYPTVNLEAQACGCKVISFDTGGSSETDIGNQTTISNRNTEMLINAIYDGSSNTKQPVDLKRAANYTMSKNYLDLFRRMLKNNGQV